MGVPDLHPTLRGVASRLRGALPWWVRLVGHGPGLSAGCDSISEDIRAHWAGTWDARLLSTRAATGHSGSLVQSACLGGPHLAHMGSHTTHTIHRTTPHTDYTIHITHRTQHTQDTPHRTHYKYTAHRTHRPHIGYTTQNTLHTAHSPHTGHTTHRTHR